MMQEITGKAAQTVLPGWLQRSYGGGGKSASGSAAASGSEKGDSDSKNSNSPKSSVATDAAKKAIMASSGVGAPAALASDLQSSKNKKDQKAGGGTGNNMIANAIQGGKSSAGDYDDLYD